MLLSKGEEMEVSIMSGMSGASSLTIKCDHMEGLGTDN